MPVEEITDLPPPSGDNNGSFSKTMQSCGVAMLLFH